MILQVNNFFLGNFIPENIIFFFDFATSKGSGNVFKFINGKMRFFWKYQLAAAKDSDAGFQSEIFVVSIGSAIVPAS
jgi:hypothetical protein